MLYHRDIGFPRGLTWPLNGSYRLQLSNHARRECRRDRYNEIRVPAWVEFNKQEVFEIEVVDGEITKLAVRSSYDRMHDIALVLKPVDDNTFIVVTVWLNERNDQHHTLNAGRYARP